MRLEDFVLYLDENLDRCKPILDTLGEYGVRFERHQDWFDRGVNDEVWLPFVGERAWIVLTKDKRNRYNDWEKQAVRRYKIREFYFSSGNISGFEMAAALRIAISEIVTICRSLNPPFIGSITKTGTVTIVEDQHGSTHERRKRKGRTAAKSEES